MLNHAMPCHAMQIKTPFPCTWWDGYLKHGMPQRNRQQSSIFTFPQWPRNNAAWPFPKSMEGVTGEGRADKYHQWGADKLLRQSLKVPKSKPLDLKLCAANAHMPLENMVEGKKHVGETVKIQTNASSAKDVQRWCARGQRSWTTLNSETHDSTNEQKKHNPLKTKR